jgi:hypothetical protein
MDDEEEELARLRLERKAKLGDDAGATRVSSCQSISYNFWCFYPPADTFQPVQMVLASGQRYISSEDVSIVLPRTTAYANSKHAAQISIMLAE